VALLLIVAILIYDGWLKRTWAGSLGMGACRFLNVLWGFTLATPALIAPGLYAGLVIGLYTVGITLFARTETSMSERRLLQAGAGFMSAALLVAWLLPEGFLAEKYPILFPFLLILLGFYVGLPVFDALRRPEPALVQRAVKRGILGIVLLDAAMACALAGTIGILVLLFWVPAAYLGRWLYST
jgi:4-hydroxybenzoate polyprenyltransferase